LRVAALYDIHGNVPALEAVLGEIEDADVIVAGGDFVGGERPAEAMELLRSLGDRVTFVRGNAERELIEPSPPRPGGPPPGTLEELRSKLTVEQVAFAFAAPQQVELEIKGLGRVLFCHATPRSDEEIVTPLTPDERWRAVLDGVRPRRRTSAVRQRGQRRDAVRGAPRRVLGAAERRRNRALPH
jgi:hypothetical protein